MESENNRESASAEISLQQQYLEAMNESIVNRGASEAVAAKTEFLTGLVEATVAKEKQLATEQRTNGFALSWKTALAGAVAGAFLPVALPVGIALAGTAAAFAGYLAGTRIDTSKTRALKNELAEFDAQQQSDVLGKSISTLMWNAFEKAVDTEISVQAGHFRDSGIGWTEAEAKHSFYSSVFHDVSERMGDEKSHVSIEIKPGSSILFSRQTLENMNTKLENLAASMENERQAAAAMAAPPTTTSKEEVPAESTAVRQTDIAQQDSTPPDSNVVVLPQAIRNRMTSVAADLTGPEMPVSPEVADEMRSAFKVLEESILQILARNARGRDVQGGGRSLGGDPVSSN